MFSKIWFSTQDHAVLLELLNIVGFFISARQKSALWKWFVPQLYQLWKGIWAGPDLKYFCRIQLGRAEATRPWVWHSRTQVWLTVALMSDSPFWVIECHTHERGCRLVGLLKRHDSLKSVTQPYLFARHVPHICAKTLIHMCDWNWLCVWHDSFHVWHDSLVSVTWLIHMCDMTHSYVWHDSFISATWLMHMCDMTRRYVYMSHICHTYE